jgi:hypothetical protein
MRVAYFTLAATTFGLLSEPALAQDHYNSQSPFRYSQVRNAFTQNLSSGCVRKWTFQLREKAQPFCDCFAGQMVAGDERMALASGNAAVRKHQVSVICAALTGASVPE